MRRDEDGMEKSEQFCVVDVDCASEEGIEDVLLFF